MRKERWTRFAFEPAAVLYDPAFIGMSHRARGAYFMLLCHAWLEKTPGVMPYTPQRFAALTMLSVEEWEAIRPELEPAFRVRASDHAIEWILPLMLRVFEQQNRTHERRKTQAERAAKSRWDTEEHATSIDKGHAESNDSRVRSSSSSSSSSSASSTPTPPRSSSPPDATGPPAVNGNGPLAPLAVRVGQRIVGRKRPLGPDEISAAEAFAEVFWPAYPRHVAKQGALRAWLAIGLRDDDDAKLEAIMRGLERYKRSEWSDREQRLIPHAATWLNERRWEDFASEAAHA